MKRTSAVALAIVFCLACHLQADVSVTDRGRWPDTWPKELDSLRAQARTVEGPLGGFLSYEIPFARREEFEAAWPHLLKTRSAGTPLVLVRGPLEGQGARRGSTIPAGAKVTSFPWWNSEGTAEEAKDDVKSAGPRGRSEITTTLVLVVDGDIVDLNRLALPVDTLIQDLRFQDSGKAK